MCMTCVIKQQMRVELLRLMSVNPKPQEFVGQMFATMEGAYLAVAEAIEDGTFQMRDVDGTEMEPVPELVEPIIVSETALGAMFGMMHPDPVMRERTESIIGNLIVAFAIALAWRDGDTESTPREAFELFAGRQLDKLSEPNDEQVEARASAQRQVAEDIASSLDKAREAGIDVDALMNEQISDEQISEEIEKLLKDIG
jgi:hypothetical protein